MTRPMHTLSEITEKTEAKRAAAARRSELAVHGMARIIDRIKSEGRGDGTEAEDRELTRLREERDRGIYEVGRADEELDQYRAAAAEEDQVTTRYGQRTPTAAEPRHAGRSHDAGRAREGDGRQAAVGSELRTRALHQLDDMVSRGLMHQEGAEKITRLVDEGAPEERELSTQWAAATGNPAYADAFAKLLRDPTRGHLLWTPEEADAYRQVEAWRGRQSQVRAPLATGGYVLPAMVDPVIMLTNAGSISPLRQLARVVQTPHERWRGITSAGATAEWKAQGVEAADGTPAAAEAVVPLLGSDVDVVYSYELERSTEDLLGDLTEVMVDSLDNLWSLAYTTGNGTTQPQGVITGVAGTASEINTAPTAEQLNSTDPYVLQGALPARFSANAAFMSHIAIKNGYAQMETASGALKFPELRNTPPQLAGKPWYENSNMDSTIVITNVESNFVLLYGDYSKGFVIADGVGSSLEVLPAYGANRRPTGERHGFLWAWTGSKVVVVNAFRLIDVPTA